MQFRFGEGSDAKLGNQCSKVDKKTNKKNNKNNNSKTLI